VCEQLSKAMTWRWNGWESCWCHKHYHHVTAYVYGHESHRRPKYYITMPTNSICVLRIKAHVKLFIPVGTYNLQLTTRLSWPESVRTYHVDVPVWNQRLTGLALPAWTGRSTVCTLLLSSVTNVFLTLTALFWRLHLASVLMMCYGPFSHTGTGTTTMRWISFLPLNQ